MAPKIRILLIEAHPILRAGLRRILAGSPEFKVMEIAGDGMEALQYCKTHRPDLVLLDLILPRKNGLQILRNIKRNWPEVRVLVFTMHRNNSLFTVAMINGADGYCSTESGHEELFSAMHQILEGREYIRRKLQPPGGRLSGLRSFEPFSSTLSRREKEVLQLVVEGYTNRQIATALYISYRTVDNHCTKIREKLGVHSKHEITAFALRAGLAQ